MQSLDTITTSRLVLRGLQLSDGPEMAAIRSDDEVNRYLNRQPCISQVEAEAFIRKIQMSVAAGDSYYWAICLNDKDKLIGTICLWNIDRDLPQAELGYELVPASQGRGIMFEAIEAIIAVAFEELNFSMIVAITQHQNARSVALLRKFGFVADEALRGEKQADKEEICFRLDKP